MNVYPCRLDLDAVTLMLHEKTMRLIFHLDVDARGIRLLVIDSPPFQEPTFALDLPGVHTVIPASQWKKVSNTALSATPLRMDFGWYSGSAI